MNLKCTLVLAILGLSVGCTSVQNTSKDMSVATLNSNNTSNNGKIFTYDFDASLPQVDVGFEGTLIEKDNCLLIQAPARTILVTPILPYGVSRWDKDKNILYIENRAFDIGKKISINGISLYGEKELSEIRKTFRTEGDPSCLKDKWVLVGTHFGQSQ